MEWPWLLVGLLSLLLLGVSLVLGLRLKKLSRANAELYETLAAQLADAEDTSPHLAAEFAEPADAASDPAATEPSQQVEVIEGERQNTAVEPVSSADTETLDPAPAKAEEAVEDSGIKLLLRQFTQDSRDMMSRIEALERQAERFAQVIDAAPAATVESATKATASTEAKADAEADAKENAEADTEAANDAKLEGLPAADEEPAVAG